MMIMMIEHKNPRLLNIFTKIALENIKYLTAAPCIGIMYSYI